MLKDIDNNNNNNNNNLWRCYDVFLRSLFWSSAEKTDV